MFYRVMLCSAGLDLYVVFLMNALDIKSLDKSMQSINISSVGQKISCRSFKYINSFDYTFIVFFGLDVRKIGNFPNKKIAF